MLNLRHNLIFPHMKFEKEVRFKKQKNTIPLFRLDWTLKEDKCHERPQSSNDHNNLPGLPEDYDDCFKDLRFALPKSYQVEIRNCARSAYMRWNGEFPFDTMIREICLEPAITYVWVAFRLLSDCVYDEESNFFTKASNRLIIPYALSYKFWSRQTGDGLVADYAKIPELREKLNYIDDTKLRLEIKGFLEAIDQHEKIVMNWREQNLPYV